MLLPTGGQAVQVVSATKVSVPTGASSSAISGSSWLLGGATDPAPPQRSPAAWISTDLDDPAGFTAIAMYPLPGYGEIAEMFGIAGRATTEGLSDIAAIGQAFGGAHGNPRTASWDGSSAGMSEVRTNFELYNGVRQISVRSITELNGTYVIFGSRVNQNGRLGAASWTSAEGDQFVLHDNDPALSSASNEQVQGLALTVGARVEGSTGSRRVFIAAGERLWWDPANSADTIGTDAAVWRSDDGLAWQRWTPPGFVLGGPGEQRITSVGEAEGQFVAAGTESVDGSVRAVFWSAAGKRRIPVFGSTDDPLSAVTSIARVGSWWIVGARMGGALKLAASRDGRSWTRLSMPSTGVPTGGRAKVVVIPDTGESVLVGFSGLDGGGLWRAERCKLLKC